MKFIANTDGGCRGNPGPSSVGVVFRTEEGGHPVHTISRCIGIATNNAAEYRALIAALEWAGEQGTDTLHVFSDSELMVKQMSGVYKCSNPNILDLYLEAIGLAASIPEFSIHHVKREFNKEADALCNAALDAQQKEQ